MAVRRVKGVQQVDGNAEAKTIVVQFDSVVGSPSDIKEALARIGYESEEVLAG